jgi:uncharacterized protein involved in response to NO
MGSMNQASRERSVAAAPHAGPKRMVASNVVLFPLAALHAMLVLPLSVLSMLAGPHAVPALASSTGHAHEMLFGFALAVVVGNQLGSMTVPRLALLTGLWVIARATFLWAPGSMAAATANIAFAALLATQLAPRLLAAAKKWRNRALPVVLVAICVAGVAFHVVPDASPTEHAVLATAVLIFALLLLFMGGRIIAPAVAGQFYRQGSDLDARVQPRIEGGLIVAMFLAIGTSPFAGARVFALLAGSAAGVAGVLATVRLVRWRLWLLRGRADLLCLGAGYGWIGLGLLLYGAALAMDRYQTAALHAITVGALGTLTFNVMALTWTLKARQDPARAGLRIAGTILLALAALARMLAGSERFDAPVLLWIAAAAWSSAFALLLVLFVRQPPRRGRGHAEHSARASPNETP